MSSSSLVNSVLEVGTSLSFKFKNFSFKLTTMPLKITTSKKPLPVAKRSSLRNRSYEVEPASGRKVYPSREYTQPVRPPPLSDEEVASLQTSCSVLRYDPHLYRTG